MSNKQIATFDPKSFGMAALNDEDYDIEEGSALDQAQVRGDSNPRLKMKKDRFVVTHGKDEIQRFDKGEALTVIIHSFAPGITQRQYFADKYVEGADFKPPACWSDDGIRPSEDVVTPMGRNCKTCNKGSSGSKECSFTSKLVVSLDTHSTEDDEDPLLMDFNINSGSLFSREEDTGPKGLGLNWRNYVKFFKEEMRANMARFVTKISFNLDNAEEYENQLLFRPVGPLSKDSPNWGLHDEQGPEDLLDRVRLQFTDYDEDSSDIVGEVDEEEDEDEDEDEPAPKPRAKKKAASRRRKPKPEPVEEEEEEEDEGVDVDVDDLDALLEEMEDEEEEYEDED